MIVVYTSKNYYSEVIIEIMPFNKFIDKLWDNYIIK